MKVIGIGYQKDSGKDTFAGYLCTYLRTNLKDSTKSVLVRGFADKVKEVAYSLYSWAGLQRGDYYEINRAQKEIPLHNINKTPREIYIAIGNKLREIDSDIWINAAVLNARCDFLILKDLRFPNEFDLIKKICGITVKIDRGLPLEFDGADEHLHKHTFDYVFPNTGSLKDLNTIAETFGRGLLVNS